MNRLLFSLTILLTTLLVTSCEDANITNLKKQVRLANVTCPINYGIGGDLLSIKYDEKGNQVLMYFSVNEDITGGVFLKENRQNVIKQFKLSLANKDATQIIKDIVNAKAGITAIYKTPSSGKTVTVTISYEELKDIQDKPLSQDDINRMTLENRVALENARCPFKTDDGMLIAKVTIVDNNVVYYYQLDEEYYNLKEMKRNQSEMKEAMISELKQLRKDPTMQKEIKLLTSLGMGYQYRYYGDKSKDYVDIIFTPDELINYIR